MYTKLMNLYYPSSHTIPGIETGKGPTHVQREGLYEELPGET